MPGIIPTRRSFSSAVSDDENIEHSPPTSEEFSSTSITQNKRRRLQSSGDHLQTNSDDDLSNMATPPPHDMYSRETRRSDVTADSWNLSPPTTARRLPARTQTASRSTNGVTARQAGRPVRQHKPGSIVRVTLTNFVTYTAASFYPGPALNMVIGPNGTGKSTLVCAICLGLGWGPKHLGRAKETGEFVKHGASEAEIEIELKGLPGKRNSIFKRVIKKEGNKSAYYINGEGANATAVLALARSYGIQVDNLCHFLPQDRVVEFAGLTPVDRLTQTLRAAAPGYMVDWHDELKTLRGEQRTTEKTQASVKQNLGNLESRQNAQRADVDRIRERDEVLQTVSMLEKLRPFAEHIAVNTKYDLKKQQKRTITAELKKLQDEHGPNFQAVNAKQAYKVAVDKVVQSRQRLYERTATATANCLEGRNKLTDEIEQCTTRKEAHQKQDKQRKAKLATIQTNIRELEARVKEPPISFDAAAYNEKTRAKTREGREIEERIHDIGMAMRERNGNIEERKSRIQGAEQEIQSLRSQAGQQLKKLEKISKDTAIAWNWIQKNPSRFRGKVYGPPLLECSVKDKRFVQQVESIINKNEFLAITCTTQEDFRILQKVLHDELNLSEVYPRNINGAQLGQYQSPVSDEVKDSLGLSGWALDYLSGPEPVLAMLCGESRIHATGVMRHCGDEQFERLEHSAVTSWVDQTSSFRVTRRREYAGHSSTRVSGLKPAQIWTDETVDTRAENDARDNIAGWQSEIEELSRETSRDKEKLLELKKQLKEIVDEHEAIAQEKAEVQRAVNEQKALPNKLSAQQEELKRAQERESNFLAELNKLYDEETDLMLKKGQISIDYSKLIETMRHQHVLLVTACIAQIEATSDLEQLEERNKDIKSQIDEKEKAVEDIEKEVKKLKDDFKKRSAALRLALTNDAELLAYYQSLSEVEQHRTPEELAEAIESQTARLELLQAGDPRTVREYEARAKEIERLQREAGDNEDSLTSLEQSIASIRAKWEPELETIVRRISDAFAASFEKINCAGAVTVHKAGDEEKDFENWAIHINVKFRENEELSLLDSHRQSGGERAVSTIFYLMALQSLSRAPFRVVDEINQGMDPRNERMVHEMMVDVACGVVDRNSEEGQDEGGSQYFLITPKLLTDLKYTDGMKVHCIASGEWMPQDYLDLDFTRVLQKAKIALRGANGLVDGVGA